MDRWQDLQGQPQRAFKRIARVIGEDRLVTAQFEIEPVLDTFRAVIAIEQFAQARHVLTDNVVLQRCPVGQTVEQIDSKPVFLRHGSGERVRDEALQQSRGFLLPPNVSLRRMRSS